MTPVALAAATALLLGACGGAADDTATDPAAGGRSEETPQPTASQETTSPEMIGEYPAYPYADYTYDLEVQCFCPYFGEPVTVTVSDGEVTGAAWATKSRDHAAGDEVSDEWLRVSIDDVLREAADDDYDEVQVTWPDGADHPRKVFIDRMENATDDEITYVIRNVTPAA